MSKSTSVASMVAAAALISLPVTGTVDNAEHGAPRTAPRRNVDPYHHDDHDDAPQRHGPPVYVEQLQILHSGSSGARE